MVVLILIQVGRLSSLPKTSGPHLYDLTTLYAPPSAKVYPVADRVDKQERQFSGHPGAGTSCYDATRSRITFTIYNNKNLKVSTMPMDSFMCWCNCYHRQQQELIVTLS